MSEFPRDTRAFCKAGYNDACINFRLQFSKYDFDELAGCIADVKQYNNYRGATVAKAFKQVASLLNKASFGREGSPVLYLYLTPNFYDVQKESFVNFTPEQQAEKIKAIKKAFGRAKVDEFYQMDEGYKDNPDAVRLWWD